MAPQFQAYGSFEQDQNNSQLVNGAFTIEIMNYETAIQNSQTSDILKSGELPSYENFIKYKL